MRPIAPKHHVAHNIREVLFHYHPVVFPRVNQILPRPRCGVSGNSILRMPVKIARRGINRHLVHFRKEIAHRPRVFVRHTHRLRHLMQKPRRIQTRRHTNGKRLVQQHVRDHFFAGHNRAHNLRRVFRVVEIHIGNTANGNIGTRLAQMRLQRLIHIGRHVIVAVHKANIFTTCRQNARITRIA